MLPRLLVVCIDDESFTGTIIHNLNGLIFRHRREYQKHMTKLFEDKQLCQRLSSQARISAETHSSKYFAEQILDVYRIAIKNNKNKKLPIVETIQSFFKKEEDNHEETNNTKS